MNLIEMIRDEIAKAGPEPDFNDLTPKIVQRLKNDSEALDAALFFLVRSYINKIARDDRHEAFQAAAEQTTVQPCRSVGTSRRQQFVHPWKAALETVVIVDEGTGKAKRLGLCTLADVRILAASITKKAADWAKRAQAYRFLEDNLASTKAEKVADLPVPVLEAFFKGTKS